MARIGQITMNYLPIKGGQETYIENLNNILIKNGFEIQVFQPVRDKSIRQSNVKYFSRIKGITRIIKDADWFWFNLQLRFAKSELKKSDILICHYPFHYQPIKWHDNVIILSHGINWDFQPKSFADKFRLKNAKKSISENAKIVANDTDFFRRLGLDIPPAKNYFGKVDKNKWFIPNCVDTNTFKPLNIDRKKVIFVPRNIRRNRGIHLAIEAFYLFSKEFPDYTMNIAGDPKRGSYYKYCQKLINELKINNKVNFLGSIHWKNIVEHYNMSEIVLIPTLDKEGTSLSALEAMACKTPVVSTKIGGLADLPTEKADTTSQDISEKIIKVTKNKERIAEQQYIDTINTFNLTNWKQAWLSVINDS